MLKGSYPSLVTPLTERNEVDYAALTRLLEVHNMYSDGLVLLGSAGEGWLVDERERRFFIKHVQNVFTKPIVVNLPCWSTKNCEELLAKYEGLTGGISGYLLAAPPYLKLNAEQVFDFFNRTIEHLEGKAIIYHNPARNQVTFTPQLSNWIQNDSRIIGICETVLEHCSRYIEDARWTLYGGEDNFIGSKVCKSSMSVGGNLFPEVFAKRNPEFGWAQWSEILALGPNPVVIKALLYLEGYLENWAALEPIGKISKQRLELIERHYKHFKKSSLSSLQFVEELDS